MPWFLLDADASEERREEEELHQRLPAATMLAGSFSRPLGFRPSVLD